MLSQQAVKIMLSLLLSSQHYSQPQCYHLRNLTSPKITLNASIILSTYMREEVSSTSNRKCVRT